EPKADLPQRLHKSPLRKARPKRTTPCAGRMTGSGRSPGLRVVAVVRLPALRLDGFAQWHCGQRLTAHSCGGSSGLVPADRTGFHRVDTGFPVGRLTPAPEP